MATTSTPTLSILTSIGIDIGKDVFHLVGFDDAGTIVLRRKIKRLALVRFLVGTSVFGIHRKNANLISIATIHSLEEIAVSRQYALNELFLRSSTGRQSDPAVDEQTSQAVDE